MSHEYMEKSKNIAHQWKGLPITPQLGERFLGAEPWSQLMHSTNPCCFYSTHIYRVFFALRRQRHWVQITLGIQVCLVAWLKKQRGCWSFFLLLHFPCQALALSSQKDCSGKNPDIHFEMCVPRVQTEPRLSTELWFKVLPLEVWYLHECVCNNEWRKPNWWAGRLFLPRVSHWTRIRARSAQGPSQPISGCWKYAATPLTSLWDCG